jgi:hypothetical protein
MTEIVMALDVLKVDELCDTRDLIKRSRETQKRWVVLEAPDITLKMPVVDSVEPNECRK